jgi:chromosome segregation ATPase
MEALEKRVRGLIELIQDLRRSNEKLQKELRAAHERLHRQEEANHRWEEERTDIKKRIEKVLRELDTLDGAEEAREVALD